MACLTCINTFLSLSSNTRRGATCYETYYKYNQLSSAPGIFVVFLVTSIWTLDTKLPRLIINAGCKKKNKGRM